MEAAAIIDLLEEFGPPAINLVTTLIQKAEAKGTVSLAEWTTLTAAINLTAADHMTAMLKAAGIDPASPQGQAMLGAAK
jgi:hypothetical protein